MATCLFCMAAPADLGRYCSGCYGRVFHEDGSPLVLGDPADPWREVWLSDAAYLIRQA